MQRTLSRLWRDRSGASALEFGLILPAFVMLVLGVVNVSLLTNAVSSMNYAVQEAARCGAIDHASCPDSTAIRGLAAARYKGPAITPVFVASTDACGQVVRATATFELNVAIHVYEIPISARACYPSPVPA